MQKRMISFTQPQAAYLRCEATRLGISVAELVRRIIDAYRQQAERYKAKRSDQGGTYQHGDEGTANPNDG